ncbi:MAG: helix-turn-helix domain-containing protein [Oscillospiraceae bacterium]|nr:helix-turn-helix domain-containing protein [Oscillospiraceae bacterium]
MTLPEKILKLRTEQELSQGELAERLEVSRQSVSKWETGQSVPDLDKIIRLADLFGVTVDELVRETAAPESPQPTPEPELPHPAPEPQVVYVERRPGLTPAQITGILLMVLGGITALLTFAITAGLLIPGLSMVVLGLPLVLAKKHPWLLCGWVLAGLGYLIFNPYWTATPLNLPIAFHMLLLHLSHTGLIGISSFIGIFIALARGLLTLTLVFFTLRLWLRRKK